jgi:hypothetical protein
MSAIETNIFEGQIPANIRCYTLSLRLPSINDITEQGQFIKEAHRLIRKRANGFLDGENIYCLDGPDLIKEDLKPLLDKYADFDILDQYETTLQVTTDLRIIRNLLYYWFEDFMGKRGYAVRFRRSGDRIAVPSFETLHYNGIEYKLVEYTEGNRTPVRLVESFFYRLNILAGGKISLVIDPKLQVLIPFSSASPEVLAKTYLAVICMQDSSESGGCELLRGGAMKFVGLIDNPGLPKTNCVKTAKQFCEVEDVKRQQKIVLPANILFIEGHPANLGIYSIVKNRALKKSIDRRNLTLAFVNHLAEGKPAIEVPFGSTHIDIQCSSKVLPIGEAKTSEALGQAKFIGEPKVVVTNAPMYVNAKTALEQDGPYSRNNPRTSYHPETITLHVICPAPSEQQAKTFIRYLTQGCTGFAGFSSSKGPFYSNLNALYYPIANTSTISYKSQLSTLRTKVDGKSHIAFVILPDYSTEYFELKALCYQHGFASQFVKEGTIRRANADRWISFFLWNFAISLYAKACGTPWKIDNSLLQHTDCYIGIQTKIQQANRFSPSSFFVGTADIFNSMGEYISCALHQGISESFDSLHVDSEFMKNLIAGTVERYRSEVGVLPRRIIIHRQLEFDRRERIGIYDGLKEVGAACPCILVHLQEGHHYRGYALDSPDFVADRSTYFTLGKKSVLLFTTGKSQGKYEGGLGTPKPTQVNISLLNSKNQIDEKEIENVCKSILGFPRLRWNTTRIGIRRPLTTFAADKIGEMAKSGYAYLQYRDIRDFL